MATTNGSWSEHPNTRALLNALTALKSGDFSVRLPLDWVGIAGKMADAFNVVVALNQADGKRVGSASSISWPSGPDQSTRFARRGRGKVGGIGRISQ